MTMGVPCPHGDVKCLLGDRMVMTSPSVVMNNFISLAVKPFASSKQTLHISMHASASPAYFVPLQRSASVFSLESFSRAGARRRCLCTGRYRTQHLAKSLGAKTPRETLTTEQTDTHHCGGSFLAESPLPREGARKKQEILPKEQAKGLSRDPLQTSTSPPQGVLTLQS